MHLIKFAEKVARLIALSALLAASLSAMPDGACAQGVGGWYGGGDAVDWRWVPPVVVPGPALSYPYGYVHYEHPHYAYPGYSYPVHEYGYPGYGYSGFGNGYAEGYTQGFGDGYGRGFGTPTLGRTDTATLGTAMRIPAS
jgi:hypothetical protein